MSHPQSLFLWWRTKFQSHTSLPSNGHELPHTVTPSPVPHMYGFQSNFEWGSMCVLRCDTRHLVNRDNCHLVIRPWITFWRTDCVRSVRDTWHCMVFDTVWFKRYFESWTTVEISHTITQGHLPVDSYNCGDSGIFLVSDICIQHLHSISYQVRICYCFWYFNLSIVWLGLGSPMQYISMLYGCPTHKVVLCLFLEGIAPRIAPLTHARIKKLYCVTDIFEELSVSWITSYNITFWKSQRDQNGPDCPML